MYSNSVQSLRNLARGSFSRFFSSSVRSSGASKSAFRFAFGVGAAATTFAVSSSVLFASSTPLGGIPVRFFICIMWYYIGSTQRIYF